MKFLNKMKKSKVGAFIIFSLFHVVYFQGARSIADWVVDNVGTVPTSSFYGLITFIVLLATLPIYISMLKKLEISKQKNKE